MKLSSIKGKIQRLFKSDKLNWFKVRKIQKQALKSGIELDKKDIKELYQDIDSQAGYIKLIIKAHKSGINKAETVISDFYKLRSRKDQSLEKLTEPLFKAKKKGLDLDADDILDLYKKDKPVPKIVDALVAAAGEEQKISINEISTLWYNSKEYGREVIKLYSKSKKQYPTISASQYKILILRGINLEEFTKVSQMLKEKHLEIPFDILANLLNKRINIIKTIKILSKAKESCIRELDRHKLFSENETNRLANIYVVEGKEKFKKALNKSLIFNQIFTDPVNLYYALTRSDGKGFKVNLETLSDYLGFEYDADINKVTGSYLKARKNKLHIKYEQIADMAQKKIDVERFIEAQIKSRADE